MADGDVIFDVGANIGMYLLLLNQLLARATVFCLEPIPDIFETLSANASRHNHLDLHLMNCGLSRAPGSATFMYYPRSAANSTMYPEMSAENRRNYNQSVLHILNGATSVPLSRPLRMLLAITPRPAKRLIADLVRRYYLRGEEINCPLRTISDVVDEHHLDRIDLLKIDTEAAEADIVAGVRTEHWPLIRQVVMEIHNGEPQARTMGDFLNPSDFRYAVRKTPTILPATGALRPPGSSRRRHRDDLAAAAQIVPEHVAVQVLAGGEEDPAAGRLGKPIGKLHVFARLRPAWAAGRC